MISCTLQFVFCIFNTRTTDQKVPRAFLTPF